MARRSFSYPKQKQLKVMKTKITRSNVVWTYDRRSPIGTLGKASEETVAKGWIVVSMKDDCEAIFPPTAPSNQACHRIVTITGL
jgi:hypothetical protein